MATFYTHADSNIRKTWFYMIFFFVFVILVGWAFSYYFNSRIILWLAVLYSVITSFLSYWYSDKIVLMMARAQPVKKEDNPELYRLVENLCITAGLPLPKIYILNESQPNAFAAGRNPQHSVVAVTRGLLERLERSELEGVIAHELSHIGNRDALLQTMVVVLVGVVSIISDWFLRITFWGGRRDNREEREGNGLILVFSIALLILAPLIATLIRLAISRKREFLADASAVLLTRYPEGLARALEKISFDSTPLRVANNSTAHLYIASPFKGKEANNWFVTLFMTHPPVEQRIKILREMRT
jgi:heat shock protein HtpX